MMSLGTCGADAPVRERLRNSRAWANMTCASPDLLRYWIIVTPAAKRSSAARNKASESEKHETSRIAYKRGREIIGKSTAKKIKPGPSLSDPSPKTARRSWYLCDRREIRDQREF